MGSACRVYFYDDAIFVGVCSYFGLDDWLGYIILAGAWELIGTTLDQGHFAYTSGSKWCALSGDLWRFDGIVGWAWELFIFGNIWQFSLGHTDKCHDNNFIIYAYSTEISFLLVIEEYIHQLIISSVREFFLLHDLVGLFKRNSIRRVVN